MGFVSQQRVLLFCGCKHEMACGQQSQFGCRSAFRRCALLWPGLRPRSGAPAAPQPEARRAPSPRSDCSASGGAARRGGSWRWSWRSPWSAAVPLLPPTCRCAPPPLAVGDGWVWHGARRRLLVTPGKQSHVGDFITEAPQLFPPGRIVHLQKEGIGREAADTSDCAPGEGGGGRKVGGLVPKLLSPGPKLGGRGCCLGRKKQRSGVTQLPSILL